jgi:uncharacterized protein YggT (Ycf19 family)
MNERRVDRGPVVERVPGEVVEAPVDNVNIAPPAEVVTTGPRAAYVTPPTAAAVDQVSATAYDPYAARRRSVAKLVQIVWLLFGIIETLLAIRFVLRLFGANPDAPFASFIYSVSDVFLMPFQGLFATPRSGVSTLDFNAIVGIVVYMLVAYLFAKIVWLLAGETRSATTTVANSSRTRVND